MSQDTKGDHEFEAQDDPWSRLQRSVAKYGPHSCEFNVCPKCGSVEFDAHPYEESLNCSKCNQRYQTRGAKRCDFHDKVIDKMRLSVQESMDWYPAAIFGAGEEDDLSKLSPKVRAIIQRKCSHMARVVCQNILSEFNRLLDDEGLEAGDPGPDDSGDDSAEEEN